MIKNFFNNLLIIAMAGIFFVFLYPHTQANELTFAQISDSHYSSEKVNTSYRLNAESEKLLKDSISQVNATPNVSFTIFTGDLINRPKISELTKFLEITKNLKAPWYAAYGNHDISIGGYLSKKKFLALLKEYNPNYKNIQDSHFAFTPKKGYRVIILDTIIDTEITTNGRITQDQLKWLDKELEKSKKDIVLIFMHVPIIEPFKSPNHKLLDDQEVLNILSKYKNPIAIFSGHYHTTKIIPKENLIFICTPSMVSYPNAFRIIKVTNNKKEAIFDIKLKETNLKDVQQLAKMMVFNSTLYYGKENDRDFIYKIKK